MNVTAELGANCSSGCRTRDHATFGECMRAKNTRIGYAQSAKGLDATAEKKKERELSAYRDAKAAGIQPDGTTSRAINAAYEKSGRLSAAYGTPDYQRAVEKKAGL